MFILIAIVIENVGGCQLKSGNNVIVCNCCRCMYGDYLQTLPNEQ